MADKSITKASSSSSSSDLRVRHSPLAFYFVVVLLTFGVLSILNNSILGFNHPHHEKVGGAMGDSTLRAKLQQSMGHLPKKSRRSQQQAESPSHTLEGLDCTRYGGPANTADFVYWQDIPADNRHVSPFHRQRKHGSHAAEEYLTFEPDNGGFNNIRMAMETVLALAFSMGRTLVLPPEKELYLLSKGKTSQNGPKQKKEFTFNDFFHMDSIHAEHEGLDIITTDEFLKRQVAAGGMPDYQTGQRVAPPQNKTNFNGDPDTIFKWYRQHSHNVVWNPDKCLAVFPADASAGAVEEMKGAFAKMLQDNPHYEQFVGRPVPVDAPALDRLRESRADRSEMCLYDQAMQAAPILHFPVDRALEARLLVYPYQFLFFQDYRHDLWMKRFLRYVGSLICCSCVLFEWGQ